MKAPTWVLAFRHNVFSQTGEDGVIAKILDLLPPDDTWCADVGAADGIHLSNTRNLIANRNFSGVMIEANRSSFGKLQALYAHDAHITTIHATAGFTAEDNLDRLLSSTPIPRDFSFLSIDIDGNDYHVWRALSKYSPRVVCIEFNPTVPTEVSFVQPADPMVMHGSGLRDIVALAKDKGYELVAVLPVNAIFVKREYYHLFEISDNHPVTLRTDLMDVTYLFSGYDGTIFLRGCRMLPWHRISLDERRFQRLPCFIRRYPGRYSFFRRLAYGAYLLWSEPSTFVRKTRVMLYRLGISRSGQDLFLDERHRQNPRYLGD
jgi:hypothetical protein